MFGGMPEDSGYYAQYSDTATKGVTTSAATATDTTDKGLGSSLMSGLGGMMGDPMSLLMLAGMGGSKKGGGYESVPTMNPEQEAMMKELGEMLMGEMEGGMYTRQVSWFDKEENPSGFYSTESEQYPWGPTGKPSSYKNPNVTYMSDVMGDMFNERRV